MEQFDFRQRPSMPWKNGGGTTRVLEEEGDGDGRLLWRLSLADIDRDGPFSIFPGMHRHHIIVRGAGLTLIAQDLAISAQPFSPVDFDGDTPFHAMLTDGPCQAVNLIFDPNLVAATVRVMTRGTWSTDATQTLILCFGGAATLDIPQSHLAPGQVTIVRGSPRLTATPESQLVCVQLRDLRRRFCTRLSTPRD